MLEIDIVLSPNKNEPKILLQQLQILTDKSQLTKKGENAYVCTLTTFDVRGNPFRQEQTILRDCSRDIENPAALVAEALEGIISQRGSA
jgi:hypothetical protein